MKSRLGIIAFMVLLAAGFGGVVTGIYMGAAPVLRRNALFQQQRALVEVFALGNPQQLTQTEVAALVNSRIQVDEMRRDPETGKTFLLLKAYASAQKTQLQAYGFRFRGLGFWAPIEGILAVAPDLSRTVGLVIIDQKETPGLGGRVAEPEFTDAFAEGLDITPPPSGDVYLQIRNTAPPAGSPAASRHVDAITGATQTSIAMERILNQAVAEFRRAMQAPPVTTDQAESTPSQQPF